MRLPGQGNRGRLFHRGCCGGVPGRNQNRKKPRTLAAYSTALGYFVESCPTLAAKTRSGSVHSRATKSNRHPVPSITNLVLPCQ